jgi:DNA-binding XRE family transcriptional regulator
MQVDPQVFLKLMGHQVAKDLRSQTGLTQEQLAQRIGLTKASVQRVEQGQVKTTWEYLNKVAQVVAQTNAY